MTVRESVAAMADGIEWAWAATGYDAAAFAPIAAGVLAAHEPPDLTAVALALAGGLELPPQRRLDQSFGQPALTLHHGPRFVIEALCWHTGSPSIHRHAFDGAFRVATGRSVHSRYAFDEQHRLAPDVAVGALRLLDVTLLGAGSTEPIPSGDGLIHATFHLDNPSMTLIARTHDSGGAEYAYLPPGVAFDPAARGEALHQTLHLLDTLAGAGHPAYTGCVHAALDRAGPRDGLELLMRIGNHRLAPGVLDGFRQRWADRQGPAAEPLLRALTEHRRRSLLTGLRRTVTDGATRFVLACLINAYDRASFDRQLAGAPGEHPVGGALRTVLGLSPAAEPVVDLAVRALADGVPDGGFGAWLAAEPDRPALAGDPAVLERFFRELRGHELLTPLHG